MLWAKTRIGTASSMNVDGKCKNLKTSGCQMSELIVWTVSGIEELQLITQTDQVIVVIHRPREKKKEENRTPQTDIYG